MVRSAVVLGVGVAVLVLSPTSAAAQNLVINPDFDVDVTTGWAGLGVWDLKDVNGSVASGSATWINNFTAGGAHYLVQCIETPAFFEGFDLSGWTWVASGQAATGESYLNALFYSDPGCAGFISSAVTPGFSGFDSWVHLALSGWSPPGFASVQIGVVNSKTQAGDFQVFHDAIYFSPNPDMIFGDGFETTDTSGWSAVSGVME